MNKIPTHDPYTGELNPYYEDLTGEKNPLSKPVKNESFDIPKFVGRKFKYKGKYGLSTWTDTVKSISYRQKVVFNRSLDLRLLKNEDEIEEEEKKIKVVGFSYDLYVVSSRSEQHYEFENCVFDVD